MNDIACNFSYFLLGFSTSVGTFIWEKETDCFSNYEEITQGVGYITKEVIDLETELLFNNTATENSKAGAFKIKKFEPICGHPAYKTDLQHIYLYFPPSINDFLKLPPSSIHNVKIGSAFGSGLNLLDATTTKRFNKLVYEIRYNECQQNARALKVIMGLIKADS